MKTQAVSSWRRWVVGAGALLCALSWTPVRAVPTMDGQRDAEYTLIASSPKDNLQVNPSQGIDDPADPRAKSIDITDVYASNSGNSLYVYVELPYYSLTQTIGAWDLLMHLGGANDAITVGPNTTDPWTSNIEFAHSPLPNVALKSNFRSTASASDGVSGYAAVHTPSAAGSGWSNHYGDMFFNLNVITATGIVHGYGQTGAEIVYKAGDGTTGNYGAIEMKVPYVTLGVGALTAPKAGDVVLIQFYDHIRETDGSITRGPNDAAPFEADIHDSPFGATLDTWGTPYTLKDVTTPLDVSNAAFTPNLYAKDNTHLSVTFSDVLGLSANTPTNYTLVDVTAGNTPVNVSAAQIDPNQNRTVQLTTAPLTWGHTFKVTVNNVESENGITVTAGKNTAEFTLPDEPTPVVFHLYDPEDLIGQRGVDPATGNPYQVTIAGNFTTPNWISNDTGTGEIPMNPVSGQTGRYESAVIYISNDRIEYKYRVPGLLCGTGCPAWDLLNKQGGANNRFANIPNQTTTYNLYDIVPTQTPVDVTFRLVDVEGRLAGKPVYVFGDFNNWPAADPSSALKLEPVINQPNTYQGTTQMAQSYYGYKYVTADPDPANPGQFIINYDLFSSQNLRASIIGEGTPLAQTIVDVIGVATPPAVRALRIAGGLEAAPASVAGIDKNGDNQVTILDAVALAKGL